MSNDATAPSSDTPSATTRSRSDSKKPWYVRWWMIVVYSALALCLIGSISSTEDTDPEESVTASPPVSDRTASPSTAATSPTDEPTSESPAPETTEPEPEPEREPEREAEPRPEPEPEPEPEPRPEPDPTTASSNQNEDGGSSVHYKNCDAARAAGAAPVYRGQAGYGRHLDRDGDGIGCEL